MFVVTGCFGQGQGSGLRIVGVAQINQNGDTVASSADPPAAVDPAGSGDAICPPLSIAVAGALEGVESGPGIDIENGIQLAVDKHNDANPGCQVQLKTFDTQGDPGRAEEVGRQIVNDAFTIGMIGPEFSQSAQATGAIFDNAGMVAVTASATSVALADNGWRTFFRGLGNDGVQGTAVANYLKRQLGSGRVCVVDDGSEYGIGLASAVRETLGAVADGRCNVSLGADEQAIADAVITIGGQAPDSVFFGGYFAQAATLVRQLRDAGVTATFVGGDGVNDAQFVSEAGDASADSVISCSCAPAPEKFVQEYTARFGREPGPFSAGGYDLGTVLLQGIDSGAITRPALLEFVRNYDGQGLQRRYQWTDAGELTSTLIWIYEVQQ
ncbi:branched chain amino acid ABC transporter substrate-binding protein [Mycobacterium sp. MS1601]|uniref:branched-chain amino acid ABC transporter substrate-binding protein n=1 Tax=Mycobacterium sp. MS1601 TaxID=1936029 RepID=UPI0009797EEC|nr:branched-chain amino acid ABC transporter substrate-binding protein [Mycobacterium sp. MS1601]AQA06682.1 branched chain amino acid ABC transporter substrate-binding protein [Mycobacterium sp. MS1601]